MVDFQKFGPDRADPLSLSGVRYPAQQAELRFRRHLALQAKEVSAELEALTKFSANCESVVPAAGSQIAAIAEIVVSEIDCKRRDLALLKRALSEPLPKFRE